ncbi:MAG TPA: hypothetical protein VGR93_05240, partial [Candidatus Acidoferrales bacterium]|nr:hypothetical protein [Candidatus Acidoferrales bacterium]
VWRSRRAAFGKLLRMESSPYRWLKEMRLAGIDTLERRRLEKATSVILLRTQTQTCHPGAPASSLSGASGGGTSGAAGVLHAMGMDDEFAGAKGNDGAAG